MQHIPVLESTVLTLLRPRKGEVVLDVTVGLGGHARMFLERIGPQGVLVGLDADIGNLREAQRLLQGKNVRLLHANFRDLPRLDLPPCDILFADLGLSSPHIDDPLRGFSFRGSAPLDARFDATKGEPLSILLQRISLPDLQHILEEYGELPRSRTLAELIVERREQGPLATAADLVEVAKALYTFRTPKYLPQLFQALRIAVNDEMGALASLLQSGPDLLRGGGRMAVITYHSLDDRMVKQCFQQLTAIPEHPVTGAPISPARFRLLTKRGERAKLHEIEKNPRARSARLRVIERIPS